jgi:hypothetical protein
MSRLFRIMALVMLAGVCTWPSAVGAAPQHSPVEAFTFFPQTGHNIVPVVKKFYDANGGADVFGFPLTEVINDEGLSVQYFERARFELWPEGIQLTPLGKWTSNGRTDAPFAPVAAAPSPDATYFPESQHSLRGAFQWFWQNHGGVQVFGWPLSEELTEVSSDDNLPYLVQYFERARLEYHPDHPNSPYDVQLTGLGRWLIAQRPAALAATAPVTPIVLLGKATTGFRASASEREHNIARATALLDGRVVQAGETFSFASISSFSAEEGFIEGYGISGDRLERVLAGGLCQVSTTLFRAVSHAGMDIVRRQGHSHIVNFYENILGFDATVSTPDIDFRWRNDSAGQVYIAAEADVNAATVTVAIWGFSDGRTISYRGPVATNWTKPGAAVLAYDPKLPRGAVRQLVHGRKGASVNYYRTVTLPDGRVLHNDTYYTLYTPWSDFYAYGPGVKPPTGARTN